MTSKHTSAILFPLLLTLSVLLLVLVIWGDADSATNEVSIDLSSAATALTLPPSGPLSHDRIPHFCGVDTVHSIGNGNWNNPNTWSTGTVPGNGAEVGIAAGTTVTLNHVNNIRHQCINVNAGGSLVFATNVNTKLAVKDFLIMPDGYLSIGTVGNPVDANVTAEIVILDLPIDTPTDPASHGTSLLNLGTLKIHGAIKTPTFLRFAGEPKKGDTFIDVEFPVSGWRIGDEIKVAGTKQLTFEEFDVAFGLSRYTPIGDPRNPGTPDKLAWQYEEMVVTSITNGGTRINFTSPLEFDHLGARDAAGILVFRGHMMNTTRNVFIHSENPLGTRGHTFNTQEADVDVRYAGYYDLGRTTKEQLDLTTYDSAGNVTHVGTNQIARYPLHFHHNRGPRTGQSNGYQATAIGNAITNSLKFGMVIHGTHFSLFTNNVIFDTDGSGMFIEDTSETENRIEDNMVLAVLGTGRAIGARSNNDFPEVGENGTCYWMSSPYNYMNRNIAANCRRTGFEAIFGSTDAPKFPGANPMVPGEYEEQNRGGHFTRGTTSNVDLMNDGNYIPQQSLLEFNNNEAYGTLKGYDLWRTQPGIPTRSYGLKAWHVVELAYSQVYAPLAVVVNPTFINDKTVDQHGARTNSGTMGIDFGVGYDHDSAVIGGRIENFRSGIEPSQRNVYIDDIYLNNENDIFHRACSGGTGCHSRDQNWVLRNITFDGDEAITTTGGFDSAQNQTYRYAVVDSNVKGVAVPDSEFYFKNPACSATHPSFTGNLCPLVAALPLISQCSDGIDNDGDGLKDMADVGCDFPEDDSELGGAPVATASPVPTATAIPTATAVPTSTPVNEPGTANVIIVNDAFQPQHLTINIGDTVTWENTGGHSHTVKWDNGPFLGDEYIYSVGESTKSRVYQFNETGTFDYYCRFHGSSRSGMWGSVTVVGGGGTPVPTATSTPVPTAIPGATTLRVQPSSQNVTIGSPVSVDIMVSDVGDLYAYDLDVFYDSNILRINSITPGNFLGPNSFDIVPNTQTPGVIRDLVQTLTGNVSGRNGAGVLATLNFSTIANGNSQITIANTDLVDANEKGISATYLSGTITVITVCNGDTNGDGEVDILDLSLIGLNFGLRNGDVGFDANADLNDDGIVNIFDLVRVAKNFGALCGI